MTSKRSIDDQCCLSVISRLKDGCSNSRVVKYDVEAREIVGSIHKGLKEDGDSGSSAQTSIASGLHLSRSSISGLTCLPLDLLQQARITLLPGRTI